MSYQTHPAAEIFPMMSAAEYADLVDSIRANGLREPIWLTTDERVLDGRNRLKACTETGVTPEFRTYEGQDPVKFVVDLNLHRRHLSESQRAMVAASLANMGVGRPADKPANWQVLDDMPTSLPSVPRRGAAEMLNVSERSVARAAKVKDRGVPELSDAVSEGRVKVSTAAQIADLPETEQREVIAADDEKAILAKAKEIKQAKSAEALARRNEKREHSAALASRAIPMPDRKYSVIYADPPWRYDFVETENRAIENHYPTMSVEDIAAMEIPATDDAVLFMWATNPKLAEAFRVLEGWGFNYVTNMVWVKDKIGLGYYARSRHELLFIAKRGTPPTPEPGDRPDSVIEAPRTRHSAKPSEAAELIERMYPGMPKLEMFCRAPREGWDAFGNEAS